MSPRRKRAKDREAVVAKIIHVISSPFPYMVLVLLFAMIVMIFVDVMSITGLVCVSAVVMVVTLVVGNLWRGQEIWGEIEGGEHEPLSYEDRIDSVNEFFESLFNSLDYSLLLIFLGRNK